MSSRSHARARLPPPHLIETRSFIYAPRARHLLPQANRQARYQKASDVGAGAAAAAGRMRRWVRLKLMPNVSSSSMAIRSPRSKRSFRSAAGLAGVGGKVTPHPCDLRRRPARTARHGRMRAAGFQGVFGRRCREDMATARQMPLFLSNRSRSKMAGKDQTTN